MKRWTAILAAAVCAFSAVSCAAQKPALEEVEKAIADGNVTVEDALEKGWVTQEWADQCRESNTVDAADKSESFAVGDFQTQTLSGEDFTQEDLSPVTFWAFLDPADPAAKEWYQELADAYDEIREKGAEALICCKTEGDTSLFEDAPFPVILYNDSVKEALDSMNMADMVEELPNTGNWFVGEYFASAWYSKLEGVDLPNLSGVCRHWIRRIQTSRGGNAGGSSFWQPCSPIRSCSISFREAFTGEKGSWYACRG